MIRPTSDSFIGEQLTQIKVIGVGGGGCNAVDRMIAEGIEGVEFVAVNTDLQALRCSQAPVRMRIGDKLTRGLGSGGNPLMGQQAAEENLDDLYDLLQGTDMIFIAAGMGGGTGTGATPVIARAARDMGILTVGVVTRPFRFEGNHRLRTAEEGIAQLREAVDTLVVIPNDRLIDAAARSSALTDAFSLADSMLRQGIQGIADIVVQRGLINVDFNDVRTIMDRAGSAWMAIGQGSGPNRVVQAVTRAINSPLLELSIDGARGVLFNVAGDASLGILEVQEAAEIVAQAVDDDANIMFGAVIDPQIPAGQVRITLIATGFDPNQPASTRRRRSAALDAEPLREASRIEPLARSNPAPLGAAASRPALPASPRAAAMAVPVPAVEPRAELAGTAPNQPLGSRNAQADLELLIPPFLRARSRRER